jgi:parvulin-like peptidyl-prolyl isomerase
VSTERFDSIFVKREDLLHPWDSILFNSPKGTYFRPTVRRNRHEMAKLIDVATRHDSLQASHILISFRGSAASQGRPPRTKEEAQNIADSLRLVILRDRAQFAELAVIHSEDEGSREGGGDLGWFQDGTMIRPFNEAVVNGRVGDVVVVETVFGFHVIHITGKRDPVRKVMAAFVYVPIEPSSRTSKTVFTEANQFLARSRDMESFSATARDMGLHIRQADFVYEMDVRLPGLPDARSLVRWAYDRRTKVGDVSSEIYEFEDRYVVAVLRQIRTKGVPSVEEIRTIPEVQHAVRNEKKAEILIERMNNTLRTNRSIVALENIGAEVETIEHLNFNAFSLGGRGFEPEVIGATFGTRENQVSNPIRGRSGVFVVQPLQFRPAERLEDLEMLRTQMLMRFQQQMVESMRIAKENNAKITDNRAFYF